MSKYKFLSTYEMRKVACKKEFKKLLSDKNITTRINNQFVSLKGNTLLRKVMCSINKS